MKKQGGGIVKAGVSLIAILVVLSGTAMGVNFSENQNIGGTLANTIVSISPSSQMVGKGEFFVVSVYVEPSEPVIGMSLDLHFDPNLIHANLVVEGDFLEDEYEWFFSGIIDNDAGTITGIWNVVLPTNPDEDPGIFCEIVFEALNNLGESYLNLENVSVVNIVGDSLPLEINDGEVVICGNTPEISDVVLIASNPLDTEPGFGWENVSATVTDVIGIGDVKLIATNPDDIVVEYPMINIVGTNTYYINTTFTIDGCYEYYVWADDIYNSENTSSTQQFELPPNEDVDMNGHIHFMDLVAIVLMYGECGPPGWVREDVDNNGCVHFMDLVTVVLRYAECWDQC